MTCCFNEKLDIPHLKARLAMGVYIIYTFALISIYNLTLEIIQKINRSLPTTTYSTVFSLLFFAICFFIMIKKMDLPYRDFGFNLRHAKYQIKESLVWTALFCGFLFLVKWLLILYVPQFSYYRLVDMNPTNHLIYDFHRTGVTYTWFFSALLYTIFVPVQTFIVHGAIQSPLMHLLHTRRAIWTSVLLSTLVFSALHIDLHFVYALSVLVPGFMWCWMYARQRSLLGVMISHAITGLCAFWILGLDRVIFALSIHGCAAI